MTTPELPPACQRCVETERIRCLGCKHSGHRIDWLEATLFEAHRVIGCLTAVLLRGDADALKTARELMAGAEPTEAAKQDIEEFLHGEKN